jgi:hypothetical protein
MSTRAHRIQGVVAGAGAFLVEVWPVLLIWRAGSSGSVGDLREVRFLGVGILYALLVAVLVAALMTRALDRAAESPHLGSLDPWGAWAAGIGVYNLALLALPAVMYALLLSDENASLRERSWLVYGLWIAGHLAAGIAGLLTARVALGPGRRARHDNPIEPHLDQREGSG